MKKYFCALIVLIILISLSGTAWGGLAIAPPSNMKIESYTSDKARITWTKPDTTGLAQCDGVILLMSAIPAKNNPVVFDVDAVTFNSVYTQAGVDDSSYHYIANVNAGDNGDVIITGLTDGIDYKFILVSYLINTGGGIDFFQSDNTLIDTVSAEVPPATGADGTSRTLTSFHIPWTNPAGTQGEWWDAVVQIAREGDPVETAISKSALELGSEDATLFTADSVWNDAFTDAGEMNYLTGLGSDNINYCIYAGTGTSVNFTGLNEGTEYHFLVFTYYEDGTGAKKWSDGLAWSWSTLKAEPSSHVTEFTATADGYYEIDLSWNDGGGGGDVTADGYLIKASATSLEAITNPDDGTDPGEDTDLSDGSAVVNVTSGTSHSFTGLSENTTYYFKIYPYTNSGTDIDFKTDDTIPTATETTDEIIITLVMTEINNADSTDFAFIEIYNTTSSAINIQRYSIMQYNDNYTTTFSSSSSDLTIMKRDSTNIPTGGDINIPAKGFLLLIRGSVNNVPIETFAGEGYYHRDIDAEVLFAWDGDANAGVPQIDGGESFILKNGSGAMVDKSSSGEDGEIKVDGVLTGFDSHKRYERIGVKAYNWKSENLNYSTATPGALSTDNQNDSSLPVELTDFAAVAQSGGVTLSWTTESETENLGFLIERRTVEANHDSPSDWSQIASYVDTDALAGHGSTSEAHEYSYSDAAVVPGVTYLYRLGDVDYSGSMTYHKEVEVKVEVEDEKMPLVFGLKPAYPNPFNPSVTIPYGLTEDGNMSLKVYNLRGELVKVLMSTYALKGTYSLNWQPVNLSAGIYFVRMQAGHRTSMQKVVFVK